MTDAEGYVTTFTYDVMDRVVTMTDAKGGVTRYTYTDRGEVATKTDAEGYVTSYEYDGNGNLVSKTDPDGYTTEYTYNALDLATKINYNDAKEVSYDTLKAICDAVSIPVIAIGGITKENVGKLSGSGICGIAVISAIYAQKDIQKAAADLKTATNAMLA